MSESIEATPAEGSGPTPAADVAAAHDAAQAAVRATLDPATGSVSGDEPAAAATGDNQQLRDAIAFANAETLGRAREAVNAIAAQGIAQAAVQAAQDAAAYLQAVTVLAATAQGVAFARMLRGDRDMMAVIEAANNAVSGAKANFDATTGEAARLTGGR